MSKEKKKIIIILGATATGKSNLAVKIAKELGGEIISADSRQVYKGLDIGTGKITKKEMRGVEHHLLDVVSPKKIFTVSEYQKITNSAIAEIVTKGKIPIICGGTGFYIDAITKNIIFPEVPPNKKLRKILEKQSAEKLFKTLEKLDKFRAKDILNKNEHNNKVRLIRAIEIAQHLGKVPHLEARPPSYEFIKIGLQLEQNTLKQKIEKRVKKMFDKGLLKEIENLEKTGIDKKRFKELGFEYFEPTYEKVVNETIKYSKRQKTYFKRDKEINWFKPTEYKKILAFLSSYVWNNHR